MPALTVREIARVVEGEPGGELDRPIRGVAPLESAGPEELSFVANTRYLPYLRATRAGAVLVPPELGAELPPERTVIRVADPHAALALLLPLLYPPPAVSLGIHPSAQVAEDVQLDEDVSIGAYAVVERGCRVGAGARIGAHVVVGEACEIGAECVLHPQVTLYPGVRLGRRVVVHSGTRLGADGFGYTWTGREHRKVPQVGGCVIGDDVEIGANVTIDRGSIGATTVGAGSKLDNLVHLGHNVQVGEHTLIVAQVGVSGSTRVGRGVVLAGQAGVGGHLSIGDGARVGAQAGVTADVPAGETVSGYPARPHREALRAQAALFRLPALLKRLREIERAVFGAASPPGAP